MVFNYICHDHFFVDRVYGVNYNLYCRLDEIFETDHAHQRHSFNLALCRFKNQLYDARRWDLPKSKHFVTSL